MALSVTVESESLKCFRSHSFIANFLYIVHAERGKSKDANWIQTVPGKGWFIMLRLYGPLDPWFDKEWRPGEIELVE